MSTTITNKFSKLTLFTDDIIKDIDFNLLIRLKEAAKHAAKVMRKNVGKKGQSTSGGFPTKRSGVLQKKIGFKILKDEQKAMVGSKDFKAHFLEFGTGDGKERNKRPFINPSLIEAEPGVIAIMSKEYF